MPNRDDINSLGGKIHRRYKNYLQTLFFFKDPELRESFQYALDKEEESLFKGPFPESTRTFKRGLNARELAQACFPQEKEGLLSALIDKKLYKHQEQAIENVYLNRRNVVVTTGTGSGKTESFLYSILFELYRQHLNGELDEPGVRAMILYPMNALANDQRVRLGKICRALQRQGSDFVPKFGQYIGQTPEDERDHRRYARRWEKERLPGELVFRKEMRENPPHILLTNYSMLEYLLIRPKDSPLFDNGFGKHWQFIVLDEAHQYKGTKGMEMGMLIRRLKQRLREGGREGPFQCVATSATMSSSEESKEKETVAEFAQAIFDEDFSSSDVIFGEYDKQTDQNTQPSRYHIFVRALEGAFLVHKDGKNHIILSRKAEEENDSYTNPSRPLEIALCRECGQHYYVGREEGGNLEEAIRDPSQIDFGVEYYLPLETDTSEMTHLLCRRCGTLSSSNPGCDCGEDARIPVKKCDPHKNQPDRLKECDICGYRRGGLGDPVQEVVHGSDGPNAVIATTLHESLPKPERKVLAFADDRQGAAYFAWYIEDSYKSIRDRNLILQALETTSVNSEVLSITGLRRRLYALWKELGLFDQGSTEEEDKQQEVLKLIFSEALTEEKRLSLEGVGLVQWFVKLSNDITNNTELFNTLENPPWNLTKKEADDLLGYLIDEFRRRRAVDLSEGNLSWGEIFTRRPQWSLTIDPPNGRKHTSQWGGVRSTIVRHYLRKLYEGSETEREKSCADLLEKVLEAFLKARFLCYSSDDSFRLNSSCLRIRKVVDGETIWRCDTCISLSTYNVKGICPRDRCPGNLLSTKLQYLGENHYRILYGIESLPPILNSEEHTAQIESNEARERQERFKKGDTHLLSSSTTFELGVDLGELEVVFMRNVPPEPFNYSQRAGRTGRRETPGLVLTYCRRNAHDLYHYEDPKNRMIRGLIRAPRLKITNTKIILRHMVATALSAFFRENPGRFGNVEEFIGDWENPHIVSDVKRFCETNDDLKNSLLNIVPKDIHEAVGLNGTDWIEKITDGNDLFHNAETGVTADYRQINKAIEDLIQERSNRWTQKVGQLEKYMRTITSENALGFLSRKAIIPKYGFPVDVVELEVHQEHKKITLQRDLSQAIAEYAAGSTVFADKREWESCGIKVIPDKTPLIRSYDYDQARNFKESEDGAYRRRYLSPTFGFVTPLFKKNEPEKLHGRTQRLYTTRPFFLGFKKFEKPEPFHGIKVTRAHPGNLVILCEGKSKEGFHICLECGAHFTKMKREHLSPFGSKCLGTIERHICTRA